MLTEPKDSDHRHFPCGPTTTFALSSAAEIAFIDFKFAESHSFVGLVFGYDFTKPVKVVRSRFEVHTDQISGTSCCCPGYRMLNQTELLLTT